MANDGAGEPEAERRRDWTCNSCGKPVFRIIGIAALASGQLRFWVAGYCHEHETEVRDALEVQAREAHPPEIMVKRQLKPADVAGWMRRVRHEAGVN